MKPQQPPAKKETQNEPSKKQPVELGHCGMPLPVEPDDQQVYCPGCHTWVARKKLHAWPMETE